MKILGVDHIGVAVSNLEAALDFYERQFGLRPQSVEAHPERGLRIARLLLGEVELELIEAQDWDQTTQRHLPQRGPGVYHFGLRVADVEAAIDELDGRGVALIDRQPREGKHMRVSFIDPQASGGALIELVERKR